MQANERIEEARKTLPELPDALKLRLVKQYNLGPYDARVISNDLETAEYFEILAENRDAKQAANWIISNLFGKLNEGEKDIIDSPIAAKELGKLLDLINNDVISNKIAKDVFEEMFLTGKSAESIVQEKNLKQISSSDELESIINKIIKENESQKKQFKEGNTKVLGWFVGQVMKETKGQANPAVVNKVIIKKLQS